MFERKQQQRNGEQGWNSVAMFAVSHQLAPKRIPDLTSYREGGGGWGVGGVHSANSF